MKKTYLAIVLLLAAGAILNAAKDDPPAVKVFILHPTLVTDASKEAKFMADYLKRWAKSEILLVEAPDGADVTVEVTGLDAGKGAGTARTQRGVFGGIETTKEDAPMTTAKVCITKPTEQCTDVVKERLKMPDAIKKFVKDNRAAVAR